MWCNTANDSKHMPQLCDPHTEPKAMHITPNYSIRTEGGIDPEDGPVLSGDLLTGMPLKHFWLLFIGFQIIQQTSLEHG